jgi:hypothetical protein
MSARAQVVAPWCVLATLLMVGCASEAGDRLDAEPLEQREITDSEQALAGKSEACGTLLRADFLRSLTHRALLRSRPGPRTTDRRARRAVHHVDAACTGAAVRCSGR